MKIVIRLDKDEFIEDGKIWRRTGDNKRELVSILPDDEMVVIE